MAELASAQARVPRLLSIAGTLVLAWYAAVAAISGADRLSTTPDSTTRGLVGWPYDTMSARMRAMDALDMNQPAEAERLAVRAVASDPMDPVAIGVLGRARQALGQHEAAEAAFRVSGNLGWRDVATQLYWIDRGLDLGDAKVAAERLDAIMRQFPDNTSRDALINDVTASVEGRTALAERFAQGAPWQAAFLLTPDDTPPDVLLQRVDVIRRAPRKTFACDRMAWLTAALAKAGLMDAAQEVWLRSCDAGTSLVHDGDFANLNLDNQSRASLFDWRVPAVGDIEMLVNEPTPATGGLRQVDVRVNGASTQPVLQQMLVLPAGLYRLSWTMPDAGDLALRSLRVSLGCTFDQGIAQLPTRQSDGKDRVGTEILLDSTCRLRPLAFWLAPSVDVHIADVKLERISN